jgi:hypothetical protein
MFAKRCTLSPTTQDIDAQHTNPQFNVHTVHIRRIRRKNQQYALIVPSFIYFYVLAPKYFGSSLPSSGSLLDPPELLENTN